MKKRLSMALAMILSGTLAVALHAAGTEVGEISYIEGSVQIVRDGRILDSREVDFGLPVHNYDQIKVGKNGRLDIGFDKSTGVSGEMSFKPGTVATIDLGSMKGKNPGTVDLVAGTIAMKVKLAQGGTLSVRSGTAAMGVRGTEFEVAMAINGDVLLSTSEGRVECTATGLRGALYSAPGNVVQSNGESEWFSADVAAKDLDAFRTGWVKNKIDAFRADPGRATLQYAQMYRKFRGSFLDAYNELFKGARNDVVNRWIDEDRRGMRGSKLQDSKDKKALIGTIRKLKVSSFMLERSYYRLLELEELYKQGIAASGQIEQGVNVDGFFREFARQKLEMGQKIAEVKRIYRLYADRNDGMLPMEGVDSGFTDTEDFFN